jgi:hypothetical protein
MAKQKVNASTLAKIRPIEVFGQVAKVILDINPAGQFIRSLNQGSSFGLNRSMPTTPDTPALSSGSRGGRGGKSKGMSINQLERKHPLAQADKGKEQYSKGGKVSYKSVFDMER